MNTQTIKQEDLRRAMALGLPLTGRENSLITLFGQSAAYEKEDKPAFVDKYLKPLVVALGIGEAIYPNGSETEAYCGITEAQTKSCETENVYTGDEAIRKFWDIKFEMLTDTERSLILSVFPDIESKDKTTLKTPQELHGIAFRKALRHFAITCPRCGGSGSYAQSVAYTEVDSGVCHKCFGRGKVLPRLTAKKLEEIKSYFKSEGKQ